MLNSSTSDLRVRTAEATSASANCAPAYRAPRDNSTAKTAPFPSFDPTDSSPVRSGPGRRTGSDLPLTHVVGDVAVDPELVRYAAVRADRALRQFPELRSVELSLAQDGNGSTLCRLRIFLGKRPLVCVGHSAPAMLHAIDTAIETAAHLVAARLRSPS